MVKDKGIWDWEAACGKLTCTLDQAFVMVKTASETDLREEYYDKQTGQLKKQRKNLVVLAAGLESMRGFLHL